MGEHEAGGAGAAPVWGSHLHGPPPRLPSGKVMLQELIEVGYLHNFTLL